MELNLDDIIPASASVGRPRLYPPDVAKARAIEQTRRHGVASWLALRALRTLHADEYDTLRAQAMVRANAEASPLPGDE